MTSKRVRGFTLLEVLVAVMIIALGFTGLLSLHSRNLTLVSRDQDLTRATLLMRELVAQVELFPDYAVVGSASGNFDGSPGFTWEREVTSTDLEELRQVRLRVLWGVRGLHRAEVLYYVHVQPATS
ncbi:MAG TPA: prepilin-type N-terminal cleavage/methylation domain-containing protein [Candidatus Binatia bacterium]|nr:prepilin-type N-terminal cleavage/methylation domain-containing protein [Candidatus Binatia bacterium]